MYLISRDIYVRYFQSVTAEFSRWATDVCSERLKILSRCFVTAADNVM